MRPLMAVSLALVLAGCGGEEASVQGKSISAWREALKDRDARVRRQAAEALGKAGPQAKSAVPDLSAALTDKEDIVRAAVATALWGISADAREAVPALVAALTDRSAAVRLS